MDAPASSQTHRWEGISSLQAYKAQCKLPLIALQKTGMKPKAEAQEKWFQLIAAVPKCRQSWDWVGDENDYDLEGFLNVKLSDWHSLKRKETKDCSNSISANWLASLYRNEGMLPGSNLKGKL